MARTTTMDIRSSSRFEVLRAVYAGRAATRQAVAAAGQVSFATVSNVVAELLAAGVLVEESYDSATGGRPRARLAVNARRGLLAGVDLSETHVDVEVFDLALRPVGHRRRPLDLGTAGTGELVAEIARALDGLGDRPPLGVGVSLAAHVSTGRGTALFEGVGPVAVADLRDGLVEALEVPVLTDNPLKAAAIAELWFGGGDGSHTLAAVTLGTGVGAGITVRGTLIRGATDSAGEWGHTTLILDGERCRCGARGCVEAYLGAPAILRDWLAREGPPETSAPELTAGIDALAAARVAGEPAAVRAVARAGRHLGAGLANLVNMINPDTIMLGGWVLDRLGAWLLPAAEAEAARRALRRPFEAVRIRRSSIGARRTRLGMATFALEAFLSQAGLPSRQRLTNPADHSAVTRPRP
ncbi:ROK family protein [Phytomonospora sp. NPDC050363]|uniref:ROK family protein n=1 Tax=Phytomonospora sp. NPDC050363 TaxID=3155642 RepID=UPI0033CD2735